MPCPILRPRHLALACLLPALAVAGSAHARTASVRIEKVTTAVATLHDVRLHLDWPDGAQSGALRMTAGRIDADGLGYHLRELAWQCPLSRDADGLRCAGMLQVAGAPRMALSVDLTDARTDAVLSSGATRFAVRRSATAPDDTVLDLAQVPLAWAQALVTQAWAGGRLGAGTLDGQLRAEAPAGGPLRVHGTLALDDITVDSADASLAAGQLRGSVHLDYRAFDTRTLLAVDADLRGGELLAGSAYIALPPSPVRLQLDGVLEAGQGWTFGHVLWDDGETLHAEGTAELDAAGGVHAMDVALRSRNAAALPARYLSGWLGVAGLGGLVLDGAVDARVQLSTGELVGFAIEPHALSLHDAGRFSLQRLDGDLRHAAHGPLGSTLRVAGGRIGAIPFGPAVLPFRSERGTLALSDAVDIDLLGGRLTITDFGLQPPAAGSGLRMQAGLALDALDLGTLSAALGAPAFRGTLAGNIPRARYADDRLEFDGGLSMDVFDGSVRVTALAMERPFGVAPTLSADVALEGLDLLAITEVFDFGSITGRLEGRIAGLRLVDWSPTAFDASFHTVPGRGVRQRISQRAVQNISSVGDASFVGTLQGQLIGLFDDFGYRRIGIGCRLEAAVCSMSGLGPAGDGFTLVDGSGLPRLHVVGFNRRVDWDTLVERLAAVGSGEVAPVIE